MIRSISSRSTVVKPPSSSPRSARAEERMESAWRVSIPAVRNCCSSSVARELSACAASPLPMPSQRMRNIFPSSRLKVIFWSPQTCSFSLWETAKPVSAM